MCCSTVASCSISFANSHVASSACSGALQKHILCGFKNPSGRSSRRAELGVVFVQGSDASEHTREVSSSGMLTTESSVPGSAAAAAELIDGAAVVVGVADWTARGCCCVLTRRDGCPVAGGSTFLLTLGVGGLLADVPFRTGFCLGAARRVADDVCLFGDVEGAGR